MRVRGSSSSLSLVFPHRNTVQVLNTLEILNSDITFTDDSVAATIQPRSTTTKTPGTSMSVRGSLSDAGAGGDLYLDAGSGASGDTGTLEIGTNSAGVQLGSSSSVLTVCTLRGTLCCIHPLPLISWTFSLSLSLSLADLCQ